MKKLILLSTLFSFMVQFVSAQSQELDTSFGKNGIVTAASGSTYSSFTLQKDGKIVVSGTAKKNENTNTYFLTRYNTDGSLDKTFSEDGIQENNFEITSVAI